VIFGVTLYVGGWMTKSVDLIDMKTPGGYRMQLQLIPGQS
jgi:hypothetical protein